MAKLRLAFWRIFMHVWLTSFFASFLLFFVGCGGNFNIRGQKRWPRLRPKLTRPPLPPLPAHFARLCALYGHKQTAAVHAALCAAVFCDNPAMDMYECRMNMCRYSFSVVYRLEFSCHHRRLEVRRVARATP